MAAVKKMNAMHATKIALLLLAGATLAGGQAYTLRDQAFLGQFRASGAAAAPDQSDVKWWYQPQHGTTNSVYFTTYSPDVLAVSGEPVHWWSNSFGGLAFFTPFSGSRPTYLTNQANGYSALSFTAVNMNLESRIHPGFGGDRIAGVPSTVLIVVSNAIGTSSAADYALLSSFTNGNMQAGFHGTNQTYFYTASTPGYPAQIYPGFTNANNTVHVFVQQITTTSNRLMHNYTSSDWYAHTGTNYDISELVGVAGGNSGAKCLVWEIVAFTNSISESKLTSWIDYLVAKFGITP